MKQHITPYTKNELIKKIKEKRELSGLADTLVESALDEVLNKSKFVLEKAKQSEIKILVKDSRTLLRRFAGQYQKQTKDRPQMLKQGDLSSLLASHTSTSERIDFYPELKKFISGLKVNSILDLGCGLNPIALANPQVTYHASDINEGELSLVREYFTSKGIKGTVFVYDIRNTKEDLPQVDLCIVFKVLDIVSPKNTTAEKILSYVNSNHFLISFATKKLSGKRMRSPKRIWFEKLLERKKLSYSTMSSENEIFYHIQKNF